MIAELDTRESLEAELQRTNPAGNFYSEDFGEPGLLNGFKGKRRRPEWEFDYDTSIKLLLAQFGTKDLHGFVLQMHVYHCRPRVA